MKKKLKLNELSVKSFITSTEAAVIKGGSGELVCPGDVITMSCPSRVAPYCELSRQVGACELGPPSVAGPC